MLIVTARGRIRGNKKGASNFNVENRRFPGYVGWICHLAKKVRNNLVIRPTLPHTKNEIERDFDVDCRPVGRVVWGSAGNAVGSFQRGNGLRINSLVVSS